jgi:hypothetical protein
MADIYQGIGAQMRQRGATEIHPHRGAPPIPDPYSTAHAGGHLHVTIEAFTVGRRTQMLCSCCPTTCAGAASDEPCPCCFAELGRILNLHQASAA